MRTMGGGHLFAAAFFGAALLLPIYAQGQSFRNGLLAYFLFSGSAQDATGNGYDGVVHGATLSEDRFCIPNGAYLFNGADNFIQLAKTLPDMTNLTLSAWVQYTSGSFQNGRGDIFNDSDVA